MIDVSKNLTFSLSNEFFSYVFRASEEGLLEHLYYGKPLLSPLDAPVRHLRTQREVSTHFQGIKNYNLSSTPQEYPVFGTSDFRTPAMHAVNADGNSVFTLIYQSHEIIQEKPVSNQLPAARGGDSQTLIVKLLDELQNLEVALHYTVYSDYGVLVRSAHFKNLGKSTLNLQHINSSAIDLPPGDYELLHLHGTWSREFNEERLKLPQTRIAIESNRGTSSAAHSPFVAILENGANESAGDVYATTLMYSGNFALSIEQNEFQDVRLLAGINPFNFSWKLEAGEEFGTPEALHTFSAAGLGGMSHIWHEFIRDKISPPQFRHRARPTYLNTWEAAYFDIDEIKVLRLAEQAKDLGVDMLVLDDGWFEGRRDDTTSLGDWFADKARFPNGIPALAKNVCAKGLKFGLWFEPEMVNPDSQLFAAHPEWALHVPGRKASLGRNQLTLDLSRQDVIDYLFKCLDDLLSCGNIHYVKWDMNRMMTEVGSADLVADRQLEVPHRYMLGLYQLLRKITDAYPNVLFENCASGGNRFDLGMLNYMVQNWTSDMCDPIGRLDIIHGCSYLFPLDVTAAYVGPSPNHQNGRMSSIESRFNAGFLCAARGISLNEEDIASHQSELQQLMQLAKNTAANMVGGRFDRLLKSDHQVCWQYTTRDEKTVYVVYFHVLAAPNLPFRHVRLRGLNTSGRYQIIDHDASFSGDTLMNAGLPLPYVTTSQDNPAVDYMPKGDFSSRLFTLKRVAD